MIHLDTHVLVWLFGGQRKRIPDRAQQRLEDERLAISPIVELELTYLFEVGKVSLPAYDVLSELRPALELSMSAAAFPALIEAAVPLRWTRDPFDRLIAATAIVDGATLLTADTTLLSNLPAARWDGD